MKKIITLAAVALMGLGAASAEDFYVGGSLGVMHNSTTKTTTANLLPEIGYNLSDNFAVGTSIGFSYVKQGDTHNGSFVFDPYARYTFFKGDRVSLFVDGGIDFSLGRTGWKGGHSDCSVTVGIGFKPGISVDLNDRFSIVAHCGLLGYTYGNDAAKAGGRFTGGGLDLSNALSFGLYYSF
ncbi:MAG: porin family protein [Bacteroides sp.]|nr:porin family protein [Bacteroides sp.]MCM1379093.1 porin family protein [Bacteroides sp.]MCM1445791.1 porin family protein [Prevotella sp.]